MPRKTGSRMCDVTSFASCLLPINWFFFVSRVKFYCVTYYWCSDVSCNGICSAFNIPINCIMYSLHYPSALQSRRNVIWRKKKDETKCEFIPFKCSFFIFWYSGFVATLMTPVAALTWEWLWVKNVKWSKRTKSTENSVACTLLIHMERE